MARYATESTRDAVGMELRPALYGFTEAGRNYIFRFHELIPAEGKFVRDFAKGYIVSVDNKMDLREAVVKDAGVLWPLHLEWHDLFAIPEPGVVS